jgi:hypothetical protein
MIWGVELTEETLSQLEIEDALAVEMSQLSLNAMSGTDTGDSMRVRALVQNKVMLILVYSGSSHSFVSSSFLLKTNIQSQEITPMHVRVANGEMIMPSRKVSRLEWWAQGYTFHTDMRVLSMEAYDATLGYDWSRTHSPMV